MITFNNNNNNTSTKTASYDPVQPDDDDDDDYDDDDYDEQGDELVVEEQIIGKRRRSSSSAPASIRIRSSTSIRHFPGGKKKKNNNNKQQPLKHSDYHDSTTLSLASFSSSSPEDDEDEDEDESTSSSSSSKADAPAAVVFPITTWTYVYALCAALNSVNLGYDLGVSTNVGPMLLDDFDLTTEQLELFLGSLNFWSIAGVLISPWLSDSYGRRTTLRTAAVGFIVGVTICAMAPSFPILMIGRMVVGMGVGVGEAIDPMYIAEIAPAHVRGELVSWAEAGVAVGVVLGFASSLLGVGWRTMLALGTILPFVMLFLATFVLPESPRWLVAHQQEDMAQAVLERIYGPAGAGSSNHNMVERVITDMKESLALERMASKMVGWKALFCRPTPAIRRMLVVGVGIAVIQQAVGIDSIMFYLMFVLKQSGVSTPMGQDLALIGLGTVKLVFVFVGARNFDHSGRRPLLFLSLGGMAVSLVVVSCTFSTGTTSTTSMESMTTIIALAVYLAFFSIGLGPGNWVVVSEIFAPSIRAKAMMLAVLPNRLTATFMSSTFLSVAQAISWPGFFLLLAGVCLASMVFLFLYLPETKGKSLEDMVGYFAEVTGDRSILELEEKLRKKAKNNNTNTNNGYDCGYDDEPMELEMGDRKSRNSTAAAAALPLSSSSGSNASAGAATPTAEGLDYIPPDGLNYGTLQIIADDDDDDDSAAGGVLDQTVAIS